MAQKHADSKGDGSSRLDDSLQGVVVASRPEVEKFHPNSAEVEKVEGSSREIKGVR